MEMNFNGKDRQIRDVQDLNDPAQEAPLNSDK